jgi:hypothetical protein
MDRLFGQIGLLANLERAHTIVAEGYVGAAACIGGERLLNRDPLSRSVDPACRDCVALRRAIQRCAEDRRGVGRLPDLPDHGGIKLGRRAEKITLCDIYRSALGGKPALTPRPDAPAMCRVSANFGKYFAEVSGDVEEGILAKLGQRTVAQSLDRILELHAQTGATGEATVGVASAWRIPRPSARR